MMKNLIDFFRAMGEEVRVKIINMLLKEEMCICELIEELNLSQSSVSHHIKILKQAELVKDRRCGKWTFYSINKAGFEAHVESLEKYFANPVKKYEYTEKAEPKIECSGYKN